MSTSYETQADTRTIANEVLPVDVITVPEDPPAANRRHDLDALRAIAMLLGIVLHAALSFSAIPWAVKDTQQSSIYTILFAGIHGFRMPLFFMLSGYFTAMLWRRRGLAGLIKQRILRIAFPLFLGCLTIVPAMWAVGYFVSRPTTNEVSNPEIWEAVIAGDTEQVRQAIASSEIQPSATNDDGATMLTVAVFLGHTNMVEMLVDSGADVDQRNSDQGTALHSAAFVGRSQEASILINAGADPNLVDANGQTPMDLLELDFGTTSFIANSFGLTLEQESLMEGRAEIAQQLGVADEQEFVATPSSNNGSAMMIGLLFNLPFFMHLWFLWFLCWLVAAFSLYAFVIEKLKLPACPKWFICSPINLLWLVPLTMVPQWFMDPNVFGPDPSVGLLPIPSVLFYYAIFFFFGAVYWDVGDTDGRLVSRWKIKLAIALIIVFPIGLAMVSGTVGVFGELGGSWLQSLVAGALEALFAWLMIFGSIGLCRRLMSNESRALRYISDSSYWLYLSHLPLVLLAQWYVRDISIPAFIKFIGITVVVSGILLLTYQYGVRYTWIGRILNGPRRRPATAG